MSGSTDGIGDLFDTEQKKRTVRKMNSPSKLVRKDRRVRRTENALLEALVELIVEKGYDRTTVQDVLDRANVGRSTFYSHFFNKKDLLFRRMSLFRLDVDDNDDEGVEPTQREVVRIPDVTHIFKHVAQMRELYLGIRGTDALDTLLAIAREDLSDSFRRLVRRRSDGLSDGQEEFLVQFLTGSFLHLMFWWLDAEMPESAETLNLWFGELGNRVLGGPMRIERTFQ